MRRQFKQLTQHDRDRMENMKYYGATCTQIADALEVHKSTISRELARHTNKHGNYKARKAEEKAIEKRSGSKIVGMKIEHNTELKKYIVAGLQELRSPDEIAGRMKKERLRFSVGTNAIYKWLYSEHGKPYCRYLCSKRVRKKGQSRAKKRSLIPNRIPLRDRPVGDIYQHAESDLFVSPTNLHTPVVGHMTVVPSSKLLTGTLLPNKSPRTMVSSMQHIQKKIHISSWTMDNGFENIYHEQFGLPTTWKSVAKTSC